MEDRKINYTNRQMLYFLNNIPNIGNRSILKLSKNIDSLEKILSIKNEELIQFIGADKIESIRQNQNKIDKILLGLEELEERDIKFICYFEDEYPEKLTYIENKPVCLYVLGELNRNMFSRPTVAIVGSRASSSYGKEMAKFISSNLSKNGIDIVSGMAYGIDAISHREAMRNFARTYAVLGCGINICYPKENIDIYEEIKETKKGAIISEFPLFMKPLTCNFPMRNRIIAGLADLIIVVEARIKSGSLITASHALEQGKEVYAVPGRLTDSFSRGCNKLIFDGASILTSIEDIIESLGLERDKKLPFIEKNYNTLANNDKMVYSCLDLTPKHLENIIEKTGLEYSEVISIVLDLEMRGYIKQISGNYYIKSCD